MKEKILKNKYKAFEKKNDYRWKRNYYKRKEKIIK